MASISPGVRSDFGLVTGCCVEDFGLVGHCPPNELGDDGSFLGPLFWAGLGGSGRQLENPRVSDPRNRATLAHAAII